MIGAIVGDIVGSIYEHAPITTTDFPLFSPGSHFTDDTVLTVAIAKAILDGTPYKDVVLEFGQRHPNAGYGGMFRQWLISWDNAPYNSYGNGSAMRVSPVGWAFDTKEKVLGEARRSAEFTHDHPEGIRGAQATALAIFLARSGADKDAIRSEITSLAGYKLERGTDHYRDDHATPMILCRHAVPAALAAFHESESFEGAVRNAVSIGDDSDTLAAIAGSIAEAFYLEIPDAIREQALARLPDEFLEVLREWDERTRRAG